MPARFEYCEMIRGLKVVTRSRFLR